MRVGGHDRPVYDATMPTVEDAAEVRALLEGLSDLEIREVAIAAL